MNIDKIDKVAWLADRALSDAECIFQDGLRELSDWGRKEFISLKEVEALYVKFLQKLHHNAGRIARVSGVSKYPSAVLGVPVFDDENPKVIHKLFLNMHCSESDFD